MKKLLRAMIIAITLVIALPTAVEARTSTKVTTKISNAKKTVYVGNTFKLSVKRGNSKIKGTKWYSSNKKVATVVKNGKNAGKVTAKSKGKCVISTRYNKKTYKCVVTVKSRKNNSSNKGKWKQTATCVEENWNDKSGSVWRKTKTTFSWDVPKNKVITMNYAGKRGGVKEFTFKFACNQEIKKIKFYAMDKTVVYREINSRETSKSPKYPEKVTDLVNVINYKVDLKKGTVTFFASPLYSPGKSSVGVCITPKYPKKAGVNATNGWYNENVVQVNNLHFTINNNTHGVDWDKNHNYKADGCTWDKAWKEVVIREPKDEVRTMNDVGIVELRSASGNVIKAYTRYADEEKTKLRYFVFGDDLYTEGSKVSEHEFNEREYKKLHPEFKGYTNCELEDLAKLMGMDYYVISDVKHGNHSEIYNAYTVYEYWCPAALGISKDPMTYNFNAVDPNNPTIWEYYSKSNVYVYQTVCLELGVNGSNGLLNDIGGTLEVTDVVIEHSWPTAYGVK